MADKKEQYEEENLTQVRSIIKQLNEDKPSTERRREVVVRADGTKVVRVTKKRKVMMSSVEKQHRSRKRFVYSLLGVFLMFAGLVAFLFFRMVTMSSGGYLSQGQAELQQRWGASSVLVEGAGIEGTSFHLANLVAEFPETSMLQRVELSGVEASLDLASFFTRVLSGEELKIERVLIVLRDSVCMKMPLQEGKPMWNFRRMDCKNFTVQFSRGKEAPVMLKAAHAYMYYPHEVKSSSVVMLDSGELCIKGWKTVNITEAKAHISTQGVEDFSLKGTTDIGKAIAEQRRTSITIAGRIANGANFAGPYAVESENMNLADFTKGRFERIFSARTEAVSTGRISDRATVTFAFETDEPVFNGEFHLRNISMSFFPALAAITEHIEPAKRGMYNPLSLHRGHVLIETTEDTITLEIPEGAAEERDLVNVRGKMTLNSVNELSGEMSYGIPMLLARVEYSDGRPDPIFQQSGDWAVLTTRLKGMGNAPSDDMAEIEARASIARRERPARIPFHDINLDKLTERMEAGEDVGQLLQQPQFNSGSEATPESPVKRNFNPFESADDPFAPSIPF